MAMIVKLLLILHTSIYDGHKFNGDESENDAIGDAGCTHLFCGD